MSLPAKEQFCKVGLNIPITPPQTSNDEGTFEMTYSFLDKGRTFDKTINLTILGMSVISDLVMNEETVQMIATDKAGELYEVAVHSGYVIAIRDIRSKKLKK